MMNYLRYGNATSIDERHRHRYEVKQLLDETDHSMCSLVLL